MNDNNEKNNDITVPVGEHGLKNDTESSAATPAGYYAYERIYDKETQFPEDIEELSFGESGELDGLGKRLRRERKTAALMAASTSQQASMTAASTSLVLPSDINDPRE